MMGITLDIPPALAPAAPDAADEVARLRMLASALTNVCCAMLKEKGVTAAVIPRTLSDSVKGARIRIAETGDGDVVVEWNERTSDLIVIEGLA